MPSPSEKFDDVIKYKVKVFSSYRSQKTCTQFTQRIEKFWSRGYNQYQSLLRDPSSTLSGQFSDIQEMNRKLSYVHYYDLVDLYVRHMYSASSEWISPHQQNG